MRESTVALLVTLCAAFLPRCSLCANYVTTDVWGDVLHLDDDTYFAPGIEVMVPNVRVNTSLRIINEATIAGDIYVRDKCDLQIQNSGELLGRIYTGAGSRVTQMVHGAADITFLDVDGPYVVFADSVRGIAWDDLVLLGNNAGTLVLRDSDVILRDVGMQIKYKSSEPRIILDGVITLQIPGDYSVSGGLPLIRNVSGDADIIVDGPGPGALFAYAATIENNDLYIRTVRETDYYKILGDERGRFLNLIRDMVPGDALLRRLDAAQSMPELENIMAHSIAFNPGQLGMPIRVMDKFMSGAVSADGAGVGLLSDISVRPFYIMESDFDIYGAMADFAFGAEHGAGGGVSVYAAMGDSDDDINSFSAQMFGGKIFANYEKEKIMARGTVGGTYATFDVPYVFDNGRARNNVRGLSGYAISDIGLVYGGLSPYIGAEFNSIRVLRERKNDAALRTGFDSKFSWSGETGRYCVNTVTGINTHRELSAGIAVGFWATDDMVGGTVSVNILSTDDDFATMVSFTSKLRF